VFYDAASLLWDNYCDLGPRMVAELLSRSHSDSPVWGLAPVDGLAIPEYPQGLPPAARQAFALVAAQRHIKALGTFGYQVTVAGNLPFARFGTRTWKHVRAALRGLGWRELEEALSPFDRLPA
jgi:aminoglycoside/choline kinase family phosphotransferase